MTDDTVTVATVSRMSAVITSVWDDVNTALLNYTQNSLTEATPPAGVVIVPATIHRMGTRIPIGGQVTSALLRCFGMFHIAVGATSTNNGVITVQRYFDTAGLVTNGAAVTASITGPGAAFAEISDGKVATTVLVTISNTGASIATLSGITIMLMTR